MVQIRLMDRSGQNIYTWSLHKDSYSARLQWSLPQSSIQPRISTILLSTMVELWSNLIRQIAQWERRTTATIEVHHKILKTLDISKRKAYLLISILCSCSCNSSKSTADSREDIVHGSKKALPQLNPANENKS